MLLIRVVGYFARFAMCLVIPSEHFWRDQRQKAQSRNLLSLPRALKIQNSPLPS